jgi:HEAT repeat protein
VRGRGKLSIEGNIKPFAMALASVWLIAITPRLPFALDMALLLCLSGLMIVQTFRIRRKYTESLTQYLTGYRSRTPSVIVEKVARLNKENFLDYFAELLEREPVEIKVYVVEILARMNMREATDILRSYILKADSRMRAVIVSALTGRTDEELRPLFVKLLLDDDARVVANSVEALAAFNEPEVLEGLTAFLNHSANRVRANVVVALWPYAREPRKHWLIGQLRKMLAVDDAYTASSALYALAELHAPRTAVPELMAFYRQRPDAVRKNKQVWTQFTRALAKNPTDEALEVLLALADNAPRIKRGDLERAFCNALEHGASSAMLVRHMETANSMRRGVLLRALMVHGSAPVHAEETRLLGIARQEVAKVYADWMRFMLLAGRKVTGGVQLLMNALLEECVDERMNNLIYISALLDKSGQIHQIMNRLHHKDRHVRARAIEILDNTGNARVNRWIINLLDSNNPSEHIRDPEIDSQVRTAFTGKDSVSVIRESMSNPNEWVRTCARYALETLEDCLHGS